MFKSERSIWVYLIGIIIMFGILVILTKEVVLPFFRSGTIDLSANSAKKRPDFTLDINKDYLARIYTNYGVLIVDLYEANAPQNVNSFISLSNSSYYNGTKFHRLIPDFLVQGGDRNTLDSNPANDGQGRPNYLMDDEVNWDSLNLSDAQKAKLTSAGFNTIKGVISKPLERFSVAMANSGPNTIGSQFFIVTAAVDDPRLNDLNGFYTVIGKVTGGTDVLDEMNKTPVDNAASNNPRPTKDIVVDRIEIFTR